MVQQFDLIIVGAGSGNTIPGPDHAGWTIAMIEKDTFGGTCLNRGCIPSKMLIHAADVAETIHTAAPFGITAHVERLDWDRIGVLFASFGIACGGVATVVYSVGFLVQALAHYV